MKTYNKLILFSLLIIFIFKVSSILALERKQIINKVENYFKNLDTLEADFIQVGPSGKVSEGKFFLDLPGKVRFDYKKPNNILITCQGYWLTIQDRKLKQTNNIPVNKTPLNFLLKKNFKLNNENIKFNILKDLGLINLIIEDTKNNKGTKLIMQFSETPFNLKKWIIRDPLDNETSVLIQNLQIGNEISYLLFFPDDF